MDILSNRFSKIALVGLMALSYSPVGLAALASVTVSGNQGDVDPVDGVELNFGTGITYTITNTTAIGATTGVSVASIQNNLHTLDLQGTSSVSGTIGASGALLLLVKGGYNTKTTTLNGTVTATTLQVAGTGTVSIADTANIVGKVTTAASGSGVLTLAGTTTVSGTVGTSGTVLNTINAGANSKTATFNSDIFATTLAITGTGTVSMADNANISANITTASSGNGTLTLAGTSTITGTVGTSPAPLGTINAGVTGETATFSNHVFANTLAFGSGNDGIISVAAAKNITADITSSQNKGTVILGSGAGVFGHISSGSSNGIKQLTLSGSGSYAYLGGDAGNEFRVKNISLGDNTLSTSGFESVLVMNSGGTLSFTVNALDDYGMISSIGGSTLQIPASTSIAVTLPSDLFIANGTRFIVASASMGDSIIAGGNTVTANLNNNVQFVAESVSDADNDALHVVAVRQNPAQSQTGSAVGDAINSMNSSIGNDLKNILINIDNNLTSTQASNAYDQMAPSKVNNIQNTVLQSFTQAELNQLLEVLQSYFSGVNGGSTLHRFEQAQAEVWVKGFGSRGKQGRVDQVGFEQRLGGGILGMDALVHPDLRAGVALGYTHTDVDLKGAHTGESVKNYRAMVYGAKHLKDKNLYLDGVASVAWNDYNMHRAIVFTGVDRMAEADFHGKQYMLRAGVSKLFKKRAWEMVPNVNLTYGQVWLGGYTEGGAGDLGLRVESSMYDVLQSQLGAKLKYTLSQNQMTWIPELRATWSHDYLSKVQPTVASFVGGGSSFVSSGAKSTKSGYILGAGLTLKAHHQSRITLDYDREYRARFKGDSVSLTGRYKF